MKLYHYTSEMGFQGCVVNRIMRLVQSTQSNDCKDTIHIHDLIKNDIEYFYLNDEDKENRAIDMILNVFNKYEGERATEGVLEKSEKAFVTCFTDKSDDRMLWTAYSGDKGYCLGYDSDAFAKYMTLKTTQKDIFKNANTFFMSSVIYDKEKQKSLIRDILLDEYNRYKSISNDRLSENIPEIIIPYQFSFTDEEGHELYKGNPRVIKLRIKEKYEKMARSTIANLLFISPILKNDYWLDENETRLIFYRPVISPVLNPVKKDVRNRNYIDFSVPYDVLKEVIIAPQNPKTTELVKEELAISGYDVSKINVRYSKGKGVLQERGN